MTPAYGLKTIAEWVGGTVRGDASVQIAGVSGIAEAGPTDITWLAQGKYLEGLNASRAGAVVVARDFGPTPMPAILVDDPALAFAQILERFAPPVPRPAAGVHPTAVIDDSAVIGEWAAIGPHVVIGTRARIGARTVLHANVFVGADSVLGADSELWPGVVIRERCTLGNRVIIHPNTTVGADGYGYHHADGRHNKIPQIGTVEIGDDVEIGANCCIDRAKFGATCIGAGTKIDNLVQVAHNVRIGEGCLIVAQCGIAGSARLGRGVVLGGQVGIRDHVSLGDGVQAAACSSIAKDVPAGMKVAGVPAVEAKQALRGMAAAHRVPDMAAQLKDLVKRVGRLEGSADD